ncbi:MAG: methionine--tRNA ligase [Oscillospiraceae bacterium]|jgi:methionyl-tRNA synthetase|nr:methionine--tRNA ligase [Oscillospiraceae bacterium]
MSAKKYYITTAIAYASQKPHIGNMYDAVVTDLLARWKRMQGYDVWFLTGTDEHGLKIENLARQAGVSPKAYVDDITAGLKEVLKILGISYDQFIRTTDDYHEAAVQAAFQKLFEQGDIYLGKYEGLYCTPCESFWTATQLVDGKCPDCGRDVAAASEEAYFFRLSKYQKWLEDFYAENPDFILPETRRGEMLNNFIKLGLQDLCVSRSTFRWGIPVPLDPKHVVYVWMDALLNYATAIGYHPNGSSATYQKYFPADLHVIGKDICRFHTVYWPIFLKALGEPIPKRVFAHQWLLMKRGKMSKSTGNVIYADELAQKIGVDAVRYYMLAEMPYTTDGTISLDTVFDRYNTDLANVLGNLVNRTLAMNNKYFGGIVQAPAARDALDAEVNDFAKMTAEQYATRLDACRIADAVETVMSLAKRLNKYIDETAPWALAKDESLSPRLGTVLYTLLENIRVLAFLLAPVMPRTAQNILSQLQPDCNPKAILDAGIGAMEEKLPVGGKTTETPTPLFARLDAKTFFEAE